MKTAVSRCIYSLCLFLMLPLWGIANPVDRETARIKAASLLCRQGVRGISAAELQLDYASSTGYLFSNNTHFAIIAADDHLPEVLGYGSKGEGNLPLALQGYMQTGKIGLREKEHKVQPVAPLLTFVRHQKAPYNAHCPFYKNEKGEVTSHHCVVGCVATALEEVISYYRREIVLRDTLHGWETPEYVIEDILPGTRVDCRLIRDNYDVDDYTEAEADAVSRLSYYCGVAAHMRWGLGESGANIHNLVQPLQRAFGFPYVKYVDSYQYAPKDWLQMVCQELYAGRPVLYTAFNMWISGHAFVVDGLDEDGFFHVNWGYAGSYDGYFRLDVLNYNEPPYDLTPMGNEAGFFANHQALLLSPDIVDTVLPDTLQRTGKEVAIDSIIIDRSAETDKHTPLTVYFHNMTDQKLTTPFEFFTNLPGDTAIFEQADFVALCGTILSPFEQRTMCIHANFNDAGERILRVSSDGEVVNYEMPVTVSKGNSPQLTFKVPMVSFPGDDRALVTLQVSNAAGAGCCGQEVLYEVGPGTPDVMKDGVRHSRHLYIEPGETLVDTVSFKEMKPGQLYTVLIRSPWKVKTQTTFTFPNPSGVVPCLSDGETALDKWYQPDGREIERPESRGVYLHRRGQKMNKIYIK